MNQMVQVIGARTRRRNRYEDLLDDNEICIITRREKNLSEEDEQKFKFTISNYEGR